MKQAEDPFDNLQDSKRQQQPSFLTQGKNSVGMELICCYDSLRLLLGRKATNEKSKGKELSVYEASLLTAFSPEDSRYNTWA